MNGEDKPGPPPNGSDQPGKSWPGDSGTDSSSLDDDIGGSGWKPADDPSQTRLEQAGQEAPQRISPVSGRPSTASPARLT